MTDLCIPCGAVEEAHEVRECFSSSAYTSFAVNLKGHGFLAASDSAEQLGNMVARMEARPIPEVV
jgi:hypothetical protein